MSTSKGWGKHPSSSGASHTLMCPQVTRGAMIMQITIQGVGGGVWGAGGHGGGEWGAAGKRLCISDKTGMLCRPHSEDLVRTAASS